MALVLGSKQRLVMIGDSITDADRGYPVGTVATGLGAGYVSLVNALLTAHYPELGITVLNTGIGGQVSRDLQKRWQSDVIDLKPDWVTMMIGTNDVWRQFAQPDEPWLSAWPDDYVQISTELVSKTLPLVKGFTLLTPYFVEANLSDPIRKRMDDYVALVKKVGEVTGVKVIDVQAIFDKATQHIAPKQISDDRIHPSLAGHALIASAVLNELGFEWKK
jgi:lysophospholipase L1-like esterase